MNFLFHVNHSPNNDLIRLGNLMGDFVKGNKWKDYHPLFVVGVKIHRWIDYWSDRDNEIRKIRLAIKPYCGRLSGAAADVLLDYALLSYYPANDPPGQLPYSIPQTYQLIDRYKDYWPERFKGFYPYLIKYRWFEKYKNPEEVCQVCWQMGHRIGIEVDKAGLLIWVLQNRSLLLNVLKQSHDRVNYVLHHHLESVLENPEFD